MRESRVRGGRKRHEGGKTTKKDQHEGTTGAADPSKHVHGEGASFFFFFFSAGKGNKSPSNRAERGQWLPVQSFRRGFCFFFSHALMEVVRHRHTTGPKFLGGPTPAVGRPATNEIVSSRPSRQRIGHAEERCWGCGRRRTLRRTRGRRFGDGGVEDCELDGSASITEELDGLLV